MRGLALAAGLVLAPAALLAGETASPWSAGYGYRGMACSAAAVPNVPEAYYGIDLVPTKRVPGTGASTGLGKVNFVDSPYGVAVTERGEYVYDVAIRLERLKRPRSGTLTAWVARSDLSEVERLGPLDDDLQASGQVAWNKFLVVVTLEPDAEPAELWRGPVVLRGMSRSGMMHTLAGHGPFEKEPCAKYGFK
jgi:hypothetical protein